MSWTLFGGVQSYDYLQSLSPASYGILNSVTITMSWASTGFGTGLDIDTGATGGATDSYVFESDTHVTLGADGGVINLSENTTNGSPSPTGCIDSTFKNEVYNQTFIEPGCVDTSAKEAASGKNDGAVLSQTFTSGAGYTWFEGTAIPNDLTFKGTANGSDGITGGPVTSTLLEQAVESVSVTYNYSAPVSGPEPATIFLTGSALVGLGLLRKRIKL